MRIWQLNNKTVKTPSLPIDNLQIQLENVTAVDTNVQLTSINWTSLLIWQANNSRKTLHIQPASINIYIIMLRSCIGLTFRDHRKLLLVLYQRTRKILVPVTYNFKHWHPIVTNIKTGNFTAAPITGLCYFACCISPNE